MLGGLVAFGLVIGRSEISRWYFAAARNALVDQQYDEAIESANKGLGWEPEYTDLIQLRANAHRAKGDMDACLRDYDRVIEIASKDDPYSELVIAMKTRKTSLLQRMDRTSDAIAIWDEIVEYRAAQFRLRDDVKSQYAYAMSLNNRAYVEAQGYASGDEEIDIAKSLRDIKTAIEVRGIEDDPVMIDTLGYLELLNGNHDEALHHLEMAVQLAKQFNAVKKNEIQQEMQSATDQRFLQDSLKELDQNYSVILHHRGEAYEAVGDLEKAEADIEQAEKLGYDPEEGIW